MPKETIGLKPILDDTNYVARGKKYATVEVRLASEEDVKEHSIVPLKINELVLHAQLYG